MPLNKLIMEQEVEVWLARDKDGSLWVHEHKPIKYIGGLWSSLNIEMSIGDSSLFPSIKWEDEEPTKAKITLCK